MFSILRLCRAAPTTFNTTAVLTARRTFAVSTVARMPEPLKQSEVNSKTDPSVAKQFDTETSTEQKFKDFYGLADGMKISMLSTYRNGIGPVSRSMAVSKRSGPDFLFLANAHSNKMTDLSKNKEVSITFHDSSKQDWISVTGEAVTTSNDDPRIKQIYSKIVSAWFGDLGDGVHTGGPEDPRMSIIEVKSKYISYYKSTSGKLGSMMEIGGAVFSGNVAQTGDLREMHEADIKQARERDSQLSS